MITTSSRLVTLMAEFCSDARSRPASQSQSRVWRPGHVVLAVAGDYSLARSHERLALCLFDDGSSFLECLSPSRQTPLGGRGKHRPTNDALGILGPTASLASPMFLLLLLLLLLRRARRVLECGNTLSADHPGGRSGHLSRLRVNNTGGTEEGSAANTSGRAHLALAELPTDWPAPADA